MLVAVMGSNIELDFGSSASMVQHDVRAIHRAAMEFMRNERSIPTIEDLTTPDPEGRCYLESMTEDPWGQPYVIDKIDPESFRVLSYGKDLAEGTEDDIVFPVPHDD